MEKFQLKSELKIAEIVGHAIIWLLLSVVTFGIAAFFYPYYMARYIIGKTYILDAQGLRIGRLKCTIDLSNIVGNVLIWGLLTIVTFGIAYFVFLYKILAHCMNHTKTIPLD